MAIPSLFVVALLMAASVSVQFDEFSAISDWAKLIKAANDIGMSMLKESRDMTILGHPCHFTRDAGWHRFNVKYDGSISCASIGQTYSRSACNSKGCAWKEPFMLLIRDFIANNRAPKDGLVAAIQSSELQDWEKQNLLTLATGNPPPVVAAAGGYPAPGFPSVIEIRNGVRPNGK